MIPERKEPTDLPEKPKRFYVFATPAVILHLQQEAVDRCVNPWQLGGLVIENWLQAGCPDHIQPRQDQP